MEITDQIRTDFREVYDEFASTTDFPDTKLTRALCKGDAETGSNRWGTYSDCSLKQEGMFSFAAHWLTIRRAASRAVSVGGVAGSLGATTSKSVGDESQSYAVATPTSVNQAGDGALAATIYGQEFLRLRRRAGMGAVAV